MTADHTSHTGHSSHATPTAPPVTAVTASPRTPNCPAVVQPPERGQFRLRGIGAGLGVGDHPGHDRPDRAPRDPQEVTDRGLAAVRNQPSGGLIKGVGVAGVVARPRHLRGDDPMLSAAHPWRVGLQERLDRAQVQRPPTATTLALVIARTALPAPGVAAAPARTDAAVREPRTGIVEYVRAEDSPGRLWVPRSLQ